MLGSCVAVRGGYLRGKAHSHLLRLQRSEVHKLFATELLRVGEC